jgi:GTPase SAR1 family protein
MQGAEGVGKTNLITRFIKDEFIEAHNLTLEG